MSMWDKEIVEVSGQNEGPLLQVKKAIRLLFTDPGIARVFAANEDELFEIVTAGTGGPDDVEVPETYDQCLFVLARMLERNCLRKVGFIG